MDALVLSIAAGSPGTATHHGHVQSDAIENMTPQSYFTKSPFDKLYSAGDMPQWCEKMQVEEFCIFCYYKWGIKVFRKQGDDMRNMLTKEQIEKNREALEELHPGYRQTAKKVEYAVYVAMGLRVMTVIVTWLVGLAYGGGAGIPGGLLGLVANLLVGYSMYWVITCRQWKFAIPLLIVNLMLSMRSNPWTVLTQFFNMQLMPQIMFSVALLQLVYEFTFMFYIICSKRMHQIQQWNRQAMEGTMPVKMPEYHNPVE